MELLRQHMNMGKLLNLVAILVFMKHICKISGQDFGFESPDQGGGDSCTTNTGQPGQCMSLSQCTTIAQGFASQRRPKICRWDGLNPIACCPSQSESKPTRVVSSSQLSAGCANMPQVPVTFRKKRSFQAFVVGGVNAKVGDWPFMAAIFFKEDTERKKPFCGGALIGHSAVLTAAHCFPEPGNSYIVVIGATNLIDGDAGVIPVFREVSRVITHEQYKFPIAYNDIAIMKLRTKVPFTGSAKQICLPYSAISKNDFAGANAFILGWGLLQFGGKAAKTLQVAETPIIGNSECNTRYSVLSVAESLPDGITGKILCAGTKNSNKDACQADSGGPLVMKDPSGTKSIIVGIIAAGFECGRGVPGLYTRVTEHLDWIESNSG